MQNSFNIYSTNIKHLTCARLYAKYTSVSSSLKWEKRLWPFLAFSASSLFLFFEEKKLVSYTTGYYLLNKMIVLSPAHHNPSVHPGFHTGDPCNLWKVT